MKVATYNVECLFCGAFQNVPWNSRFLDTWRFYHCRKCQRVGSIGKHFKCRGRIEAPMNPKTVTLWLLLILPINAQALVTLDFFGLADTIENGVVQKNVPFSGTLQFDETAQPLPDAPAALYSVPFQFAMVAGSDSFAHLEPSYEMLTTVTDGTSQDTFAMTPGAIRRNDLSAGEFTLAFWGGDGSAFLDESLQNIRFAGELENNVIEYDGYEDRFFLKGRIQDWQERPVQQFVSTNQPDQPVPEPASAALLGLGGLMAMAIKQRRRENGKESVRRYGGRIHGL